MTTLHATNHVHSPGVALRKILPLAQWPSSDRCLWLNCRNGHGPHGTDNRAVRWSTRSCENTVAAYGRFLSWHQYVGNLGVVTDPASRITPDVVSAFMKHMADSGLAPVTIGIEVDGLNRIAHAFAPDADWSWLRRKYWRQKHRSKPSRDKLTRVVPALALYTLGIHLMETATNHARHVPPVPTAFQYRNGLIIALMAARPLRIRNFQHIELFRTLVYRSGRYWLVFGEEETKTGRPIEVEVPRPLTPYLDQYLRLHRNVLLARRPVGTKPTTALWVGKLGQKMPKATISYNIIQRTKAAFGHAINPHLFRDCAATSFATDDPEHVRCIAAVLGHTTLRTSEGHYNQATMRTAVRTFSSAMMKIRKDLLETFDDKAVRAFLVQAQQIEGPDDGI